MMHSRIEDFERDPSWQPSTGEQFWKRHFRQGRYHAVCDPTTGNCSVHRDEDDPHESLTSLFKHLAKNKTVQGAAIVAIGATASLVLDEVLNDGKGRKKVKKTLFG